MENTYMSQSLSPFDSLSLCLSNNNNSTFEYYFNSVFPPPPFFDNSSILKLTIVSLFIINITTLVPCCISYY